MNFIAKRKDVNPKSGVSKYGNVKYADPKNKKYPIDTEEHVRAAWNYINKAKNAAKYSASDLKTIKGRIVSAWKSKIDKSGPPSAKEMSKEFAMIPVNDFVIFRAGDYGEKGKYTEKELDEMVDNFDAENPPAVIVGHTSGYTVKTAIPKFGVIGGLTRKGKDLVATGVQFSDKLIGWVKEGFYGDRSPEIATTKEGKSLYRLGILGAAPPEVSGMPALSLAVGEVPFSENEPETVVVDFSEGSIDVSGDIEVAAIKDTMLNIDQSMATAYADIENHLSSNDEYEEILTNSLNALWELVNDVTEELREHKAFCDKLEGLEGQDTESMSKTEPILTEWVKKFKSFLNILPKGEDMDAKQEQAYKDQLAEKDAKLAEFAKKEQEAAELKLAAEKKAAEDALRAEIAAFCKSDENKLIAKKLEDMHFEEFAFSILKDRKEIEFSGGQKLNMFDILKGLVANMAKPVMGETEFAKDVELGKKYAGKKPVRVEDLKVLEGAHKYLEAHRTEFSGKTDQEAISSILILAGTKKITL